MNQAPSHAGRHLLDRRSFLQFAGTGLGGIALASLLAADEHGPLRPTIRPEAPLAPRPPHSAAKAKRVLMIFCSGAVSHVDTFDYKPELVKRDGQPMPGSDKLVTFQGENGNLVRPLWTFKPRGQSGKMVSDLLPNLAELADEMCFIHSMTAKSNTHGPAENQMSTGFTLDGFPSVGAWVSYALGSECADLPAFVAIPDPRGVPQVGPNNWGSAFLPAVFQGTAFNADKPIPNLARPAAISEPTEAATRDFLKLLNERHLAAPSRRYGTERPHRQLRAGREDAAARRRGRRPVAARTPRRCTQLRRRRREQDRRPASRATACWPAGCWSAAFASCSYSTAPTRWARASATGTATRRSRRSTTVHAPILDQPCAALLKDLKQRGLLERHAGRLGDGVRPDADVPEGGQRPRPQSEGLHRLAGRRRRAAGVQLRRDGRVRLPGRREGRRRSTTCTRRSCTCSAWITNA